MAPRVSPQNEFKNPLKISRIFKEILGVTKLSISLKPKELNQICLHIVQLGPKPQSSVEVLAQRLNTKMGLKHHPPPQTF